MRERYASWERDEKEMREISYVKERDRDEICEMRYEIWETERWEMRKRQTWERDVREKERAMREHRLFKPAQSCSERYYTLIPCHEDNFVEVCFNQPPKTFPLKRHDSIFYFNVVQKASSGQFTAAYIKLRERVINMDDEKGRGGLQR